MVEKYNNLPQTKIQRNEHAYNDAKKSFQISVQNHRALEIENRLENSDCVSKEAWIIFNDHRAGQTACQCDTTIIDNGVAKNYSGEICNKLNKFFATVSCRINLDLTLQLIDIVVDHTGQRQHSLS